MENPIILLVFWVFVNFLIKNSRDKKKAEEARRKSGHDIPVNRQKPQAEKSRMNTGMKNFRKALDEYKEQIERELNPEKQIPSKTVKVEEEKTTYKQTEPKTEPKIETYREGLFDVEESKAEAGIHKKEVVVYTDAKESSQGTGKLIDLKSDILKGVIYAEILGKPKSLKNKRSPF